MDVPTTTNPRDDTPVGVKKPRTCPYCKRVFCRHEHLRRHIRIHTKEKPFKCACGSSFTRRDLLKRHHNITHGAIGGTDNPSPPIPGSSQQPDGVQVPITPVGSHPTAQGSSTLPVATKNLEDPYTVDLTTQDSLEYSSLLDTYDPLQDFESFSHNMGLSLDWTLPSESAVTFAGFQIDPVSSGGPASQDHSGTAHPLLCFGLLPNPNNVVAEFGVLTLPILRITDEHRDRLVQSLIQCQATVTESFLPSCHSLTRFVNAFFDGFYPHFPIVHIPTFDVEDCFPELVLSMAALGAQYRHEHRKGVLLFYAAKSILQKGACEREKRMVNETLLKSTSGFSEAPYSPHFNSAGTLGETTTHSTQPHEELMREARCTLYLIVFATWQRETELVGEAFALQSSLVRCLRESGLGENMEVLQNTVVDWRTWAQQESDRRVKIFSFAFLNLQCIAFNVSPILLSNEIQLRLPSSCMEWIAPDQAKWALVRESGHQEQVLFQDGVKRLMRGFRDTDPNPGQRPSPLANYILLHAIIQQIILTNQALFFAIDDDSSLQKTQSENFIIALRAWTSQWQKAPESSLDPRNPNGPIPFTSTALLGLAYVRLSFDLGPYKILEFKAPEKIACKLLHLPPLSRGPHLLPGLLYATHALSIPVKLGIEYVSRSQAFVWSVQHSLCGLEFAVLLSKWLHSISESQEIQPLDGTTRLLSEFNLVSLLLFRLLIYLLEHESHIINWTSDVVEEGRTSCDEDLCPAAGQSSSSYRFLAFSVLKLWARLMRGNVQWAIIKIIGEGLDIYADTCRDGHNPR